MPTIFCVPNPPQQLFAARRPLKRRVTETSTSLTLSTGDETSAEATFVAPRSDHTYSLSSQNGGLENSIEADDYPQATRRCARPAAVHRRITTKNEKRLRTIILRQRVKICRLRKKVVDLRSSNQQPKLSVFANVDSPNNKQLSDFFARQMRLSARKKFGRRFSPIDKSFALSLYFSGPKAYSLCQRLFVLPSKRTLQIWLAKLDIKPGFTESVFSLLEKKVNSMAERDRVCILLLDEMSLKSALSYDTSRDVIVGFEDYGHLGTGKELANSALVFMVKGICSKWKQPIGYFLAHNTTSADKLKLLVLNAIEKLANIGLSVRVVICDQGATNQQMFRFFGVSVDQPFVEVGGSRVVFMFDSPHLLKNVRNNLLKHDFIIGLKRVSWKYIAAFYESDSKRSIRMAPRLTKKHLDLPPFAAMRVCLAAQVLSHTVAAGICTYIDLSKMPDEAIHTAEFVKLIDGLFDSFNSRFCFDKKMLRRPISAKSDTSHWPHLHDCEQQLKSLKVAGSKAAIPCLSGWLMNINALKLLWEILKSEYNFSFLLTSRLNQDSLENLFSVIRGRGGHRDNPDPVHFHSAFKQVLVQNMFVPAPSSNCKDDSGEYLLNIDDFSIRTDIPLVFTDSAKATDGVTPLLAASEAFSKLHCGEMSDSIYENTLTYIAGYVCRKVLDKHNCAKCRLTMLRNDTSTLGDKDLFCAHKAYNSSHSSFGGLKAPSNFVFMLMGECERVFDCLFDTFKYSFGVRQKLIEAASAHLSSGENKPCIEAQRSAVNIYMTTRLHYKVKFFNRDAKVSAKHTTHQPGKRKNRKAMKIMHK